MSDNTMTLTVGDILETAKGTDPDGSPRSAASLSIDLVDGSHADCLREEVLEQAVFGLAISGGAAVVTADFPAISRGAYTRCLELSRDYLGHLKDPAHDREVLSLILVPFLLEGQVILHFTQLVFCDGYEKEGTLRLILAFDNQACGLLETDQIDYETIHREIDLELKRYEEDIDADIEEALEEEKEAKRQENQIDREMKERLRHPFDQTEEEQDPAKQRESEEHPNVRFSDDEDGEGESNEEA